MITYLISNSELDEMLKADLISSGIYTFKNLFDHYFLDHELNELKLSEAEKQTLIHLIHETLSYFNSRDPYTASTDQTQIESISDYKEEAEDDLVYLHNENISDLRNREEISNALFKALSHNGILDLDALRNYYNQNQTFLSLPRVGSNKNIEAIRLIRRISYDNPSAIHDKQIDDRIEEEFEIDKRVFSQLLEIRNDNFKKSQFEFLGGLLALSKTEFENKVRMILTKTWDHKGFGRNKKLQIQVFLQEAIKVSMSEELKSELEFDSFCLNLGSIAKIERNRLAPIYETKNGLKLLEYVLLDNKGVKDVEKFIYDKVAVLKIKKDGGPGLKYEEARLEYSEILERDIPKGTWKPWIKRARERVDKMCLEMLNEYPAFFSSLDDQLRFSNAWVQVPSALLSDLNEEYETNYSLLFFVRLLELMNEEYESLFDLTKNVEVESIPFVRNSEITNQNKLDDWKNHIRYLLSRRSPREYQFELNDETHPFSDTISIDQVLKTFEIEYSKNGNTLILSANVETPKRLVDYAIEILQEKQEPMDYQELLSMVRNSYPEVHISSERALKDQLYVSDKTMSLGGITNLYILSEWQHRFPPGPIKEFIIKYLMEKEEPVHYFEIYEAINEERSDINLEGIVATLNTLKEVFNSHNGGFYSLRKNSVNEEGKYYRINAHVIGGIEKMLKQGVKEAEVISRAQTEYPNYKPIQIKFIIYQFKEGLK